MDPPVGEESAGSGRTDCLCLLAPVRACARTGPRPFGFNVHADCLLPAHRWLREQGTSALVRGDSRVCRRANAVPPLPAGTVAFTYPAAGQPPMAGNQVSIYLSNGR